MSQNVSEALRPGFSALSDFSSILGKALEAIEFNVVRMEKSMDGTFIKIHTMDESVLNHEKRLKLLESEYEAQRAVTENIMKITAGMEKNIGNQLSDATKNLHKELIIQRTVTKMDISALKGRLSDSMSELFSTLATNPQKIYNPSVMPSYNPNFTTDESIRFLVEKMGHLEDALGLQNKVNDNFSKAIAKDDVVNDIYNSLIDEISALNNELTKSQKENNDLKNSMREMKNYQLRQERTIAEILEALSSKDRLKLLREEIRKTDKAHRVSMVSHLSEIPEGDQEDLDGDNPSRRKASTSSSHKRRKRKTYVRTIQQIDELDDPNAEQEDDEEQGGEGEGEGGEQGDSRPASAEKLEDGTEIPSFTAPKRAPIKANFSTLVKKEKKRSRKSSSSSRAEEEQGNAEQEQFEGEEGIPEEGEQEEEVEADVTTEQQQLEESEANPELTTEPRSKPAPAKTPKKKPSKIVEKVKRIERERKSRDYQDEEEPVDQEEEGGDDLDLDGEEEEEEPQPQKQRGPSQEKRKASSNKSDNSENFSERKASKYNTNLMPVDSKPADHRKDTQRASKFYRGFGDEEENATPEQAKKAAAPATAPAKASQEAKNNDNEQQDNNDNKNEEGKEFWLSNDTFDPAAAGGGGGGDPTQDDGANSVFTAESSFFEGSDSMYNDESSLGRHVIDVIEANNIETANVLNSLREEYNDRLDSLENALATFKRIAFVIDDLKIGFEAVRKKVDAVATGETLEEKIANATNNKILKLKDQWSRVYSELIFALENVNPNELEKEESDLLNSDAQTFFTAAKELSYAIEDGLDDFNPRETLDATMIKLFPSLDKMHEMAEKLIAMDEKARLSQSLDYCFDDMLCSDLTPSLRGLIAEVVTASLPVLDEGVHKIRIQRKLNHLVKDVEKKADQVFVDEHEHETRRMLQNKVDQTDFMTITSKMATASELQRIQNSIADGHGGGGSGGGFRHGNSSSDYPEHSMKPLTEQPEFTTLLERFNTLATKQLDLEARSDKLVPKEEVHEALKAIVAEIKNLRKNCVLLPVFREGLKGKADVHDMERLIKTITEVIGDFNFSSEFASTSAAIHAKCLICDKPVSSQRSRKPGSASTTTLLSKTMPVGYDKNDDEQLQSKRNNNNSSEKLTKRMASPNPAVSKSAKAKVAGEMTIIRSTIEPLPEISDSLVESPRQQQSALLANDVQLKQRLRNSAGGGVGPNYKMDTR